MHLREDALANSSFATLLLLSPPSELPRRISMIRHYVARRAKVIEDHPHNAE